MVQTRSSPVGLPNRRGMDNSNRVSKARKTRHSKVQKLNTSQTSSAGLRSRMLQRLESDFNSSTAIAQNSSHVVVDTSSRRRRCSTANPRRGKARNIASNANSKQLRVTHTAPVLKRKKMDHGQSSQMHEKDFARSKRHFDEKSGRVSGSATKDIQNVNCNRTSFSQSTRRCKGPVVKQTHVHTSVSGFSVAHRHEGIITCDRPDQLHVKTRSGRLVQQPNKNQNHCKSHTSLCTQLAESDRGKSISQQNSSECTPQKPSIKSSKEIGDLKTLAKPARMKSKRNSIKLDLADSMTTSIDSDDVCDVCGDGDSLDNNLIVFCEGEGCSVVVHQSCYGILIVPQGENPWMCDRCKLRVDGADLANTCSLCNIECEFGRGAVKRVNSTQDAMMHTVCALGYPSVGFVQKGLLQGIVVDNHVTSQCGDDRACMYCSRRDGLKVSCKLEGCDAVFHVYCGSKCGARLTLSASGGNKPVYCASHAALASNKSNMMTLPTLEDVPKVLQDVWMCTRVERTSKGLKSGTAKPGRSGPTSNICNDELKQFWEAFDTDYFTSNEVSQDWMEQLFLCIQERMEHVHLCKQGECQNILKRRRRKPQTAKELMQPALDIHDSEICDCMEARKALDDETLSTLEEKYAKLKQSCSSGARVELLLASTANAKNNATMSSEHGSFVTRFDFSPSRNGERTDTETVRIETTNHALPSRNPDRMEALRIIETVVDQITPGGAASLSRSALYNAAAHVMANDFEAFSESLAGDVATVLLQLRKGKEVDLNTKSVLNRVIQMGLFGTFRVKKHDHLAVTASVSDEPSSVLVTNSFSQLTENDTEVDHEIWALEHTLRIQQESNHAIFGRFLNEVVTRGGCN